MMQSFKELNFVGPRSYSGAALLLAGVELLYNHTGET